MGFFSSVGRVIGDISGAITGAGGVEEAANRASSDTLKAAREARALNVERYGKAEELLDPYLKGSERAYNQLQIEAGLMPGEANTAYMNTPGYKAAMGGVQQSLANAGGLYSGRRIGASQEVQSQFYNNYMNLLQSMGNPNVATNLASLGVNQAATMGNQQMSAQQAASDYRLEGAGAIQAGTADIISGASNIISGGLKGGYLGGGGGM